MSTTDLDQEIRTRTEAFVSSISTLVRQSAVEAVASVLGDGMPLRRGPGRPRGVGGRGPIRALRSLGGSRRKGQKRDPRALTALTERLYGEIKGKPGRGIEEIARSMGIGTKELTLPVKKLLATKKVSRRGQKRATKYFAK